MIVYCNCAYSEVIPADTRSAVHAGIASRGAGMAAVADLCELAARRDARLARWARMPDLTIVACHPRAVRALFEWSGAPLRTRGVSFLDMRALNATEVLKRLPPPARGRAAAKNRDVSARGPWTPWFPVLDRTRCVNCKQCASFCAFGVYTVQDGTVTVTNPANCKNNCPACARMCPHLAIIFPKCAEEPIGGAAVTPAHIRQRRAMAKKPVQGADMHALLAARTGHAGPHRT